MNEPLKVTVTLESEEAKEFNIITPSKANKSKVTVSLKAKESKDNGSPKTNEYVKDKCSHKCKINP